MRNLKRKSIRLKTFNYSQVDGYYITLCSLDRICLFGRICDDQIILGPLGKIVVEEWLYTPILRPNVQLGEFIVMPNHFHGIIIINENRRGVLQYAPTNEYYSSTAFRSPSQTIGAIVRGFKSAVTKKINTLRKSPGQPIWQRNYFEHIIRNDADMRRIGEYICNNPKNWKTDENYR
ncbi:MAG: transposase [Candidatus Omnitrophica bacterium]|nr:transposase [Candidatus Omnitrophota bacterium]